MPKTISGQCRTDFALAGDIEITAYRYNDSSTILSQATTDKNGFYQLSIPDNEPEITVVSKQNYGNSWTASTTVSEGDIVHPTPSYNKDITDEYRSVWSDLRFDKDLITDSYHGMQWEVVGTTTLSNNGKFNNCVEFSNRNGCLKSLHQKYNNGRLNCSFEFYYNPKSLPDGVGGNDYHTFFSSNSGANLWAYIDSAGNVNWEATGGEVMITPTAHGMSTDTWYHWSFVWDISNNIRVYRDGTEIVTGTTANDHFFNIDFRWGGQDDGVHSSDGKFSECRVLEYDTHNANFTPEQQKIECLSVVYKCTTGGTTGSTEPVWSRYLNVNDNGVIWQPVKYHKPEVHGPIEVV